TFGYSGGPILVGTGGREMEVAGIQIAAVKSGGAEKMLAIPAQMIGRADRPELIQAVTVCDAPSKSESVMELEAIRTRLDMDRPDVVASIQPVGPIVA